MMLPPLILMRARHALLMLPDGYLAAITLMMTPLDAAADAIRLYI